MSLTSRRSLLAAIPAVALAAPLPRIGEGADPIFAVIEVYKKASEEYTNAYCAGVLEDNPALDARQEAADAAFVAAMDAIWDTQPATLAGCAALLALYISEDPWFAGSVVWHEGAMRNVLATLQQMSGRSEQ